MSWLEPKQDWEIKPYGEHGEYMGDWFSVDADYPRVTGNIEYLASVSNTAITPMPAQSFTVEGPLAVIFNNIENNLDALDKSIMHPTPIPPTKQWAGNQPAPTVEDWNRWEFTLDFLYHFHHSPERNRNRLAFRLNGGRF